MPKRNYKKLKKNLKKKLQKIKNYKISDNKLAALVFIVTAVLGARIGNYIRIFAFQKEKEQNDPYEPYSEYYGRPPDDEGKWDDDPRRGSGYVESTVSLFGKNRNKKIALASILGGTLGVGTGYYLRDKFYKRGKKNEKEMKERQRKDDEEFEEEIKRLLELNDRPPTNSEYSEGIKFDFEDFNKNFEEISKNDKDDEDFEIKAEIDPGTTGLKEEEDFMRAMEELNKSKKKLKEKKKKEKRIFRNKGAKKRINSIKEQIKNNEQQANELEKFYDDYFENKEKRLTTKDLIRILSRETGKDKDNLKYYSYWELYKMYTKLKKEQKAEEEQQRYIQNILDSSKEKPVQEVMLFGKKKRKRRKKKRK